MGSEKVAGRKLKEAGTSHWRSSNKDTTDESGFSTFPGGWRGHLDGRFGALGSIAFFWSATERDASHAWYRSLGLEYGNSNMNRHGCKKQGGFSVRLLRD
jgi:uncharacterized protein (TIGR02145 family)